MEGTEFPLLSFFFHLFAFSSLFSFPFFFPSFKFLGGQSSIIIWGEWVIRKKRKKGKKKGKKGKKRREKLRKEGNRSKKEGKFLYLNKIPCLI